MTPLSKSSLHISDYASGALSVFHFDTSSPLHEPFSCPSPLATFSSPRTLLAPINMPPTYPPRNRISPACTLVILTKFSVSARCAFSCASWLCRCAYWRFLLVDDEDCVVGWVEGREEEVEVEGSGAIVRRLVGVVEGWLRVCKL